MPRRYKIQAKDLSKELTFSASKSSGPGGQHVNKVNTKVTLRFDVVNSTLLNEEQKATILKNLTSKLLMMAFLYSSHKAPGLKSKIKRRLYKKWIAY